MLYTIPNVDRALSNIGFHRCNDGLVYLRKVNHHIHPYHILVGSPAFLFLELEKNVALYTAEMFDTLAHNLLKHCTYCYTNPNYIYKTIIAVTGEFYFHQNELDKADQYERYHQYLIENNI